MSSNDQIVLLWDIDGTLLTTARAGIIALERALEEVSGRRIELTYLASSGLTEHMVAQAVFAAAELAYDDRLVDRLLRSYERHLPDTLPLREGRVLPGVREALEDLTGREGVHNLLLTGNTRLGARAKLSHYGLSDFFADGAFCVGPGSRADIARRAVELAEQLAGSAIAPERLFVIGDTPHDIEAGKAIGARTIAVASGGVPREELETHEPWALLDDLDPARLVRLLGLDGRA